MKDEDWLETKNKARKNYSVEFTRISKMDFMWVGIWTQVWGIFWEPVWLEITKEK